MLPLQNQTHLLHNDFRFRKDVYWGVASKERKVDVVFEVLKTINTLETFSGFARSAFAIREVHRTRFNSEEMKTR